MNERERNTFNKKKASSIQRRNENFFFFFLNHTLDTDTKWGVNIIWYALHTGESDNINLRIGLLELNITQTESFGLTKNFKRFLS